MGMILAMTSIDEKTADRLRANSLLIWQLLGVSDVETPITTKPDSGGWFSRLFGRATETELPESASVANVHSIEEIDLDKAWNGIHYLLTGSAYEGDSPINFLLQGGSEVGDIDVGYGPARLVAAKDVVSINNALRSIDRGDLRAKFDPAQMMDMDIYPSIWDHPADEGDPFEYCAEYFEEMKEFFSRSANQNLSVIISIQ